MELVEALQSGLPTPYRIIMDLEVCVFPLYPNNCKGFASSDIVIIWKVLCLEMANTLTIYKFFVSALIKVAGTLNLSVYIVYYMESILLANPSEGEFYYLCSYSTTSFKVLGSSCCS